MQQLTPERFQTLAAALAWDPERRWLLGARLVENVPYRALAAHTGRTPGALATAVSYAKRQIEAHEQRQEIQRDEQSVEEEMERRYAGLFGKALLFWDLTDHHFPLWACVLVAFGLPDVHEDPLPLEEQWELMEYKWERDKAYAAGEGPAA